MYFEPAKPNLEREFQGDEDDFIGLNIDCTLLDDDTKGHGKESTGRWTREEHLLFIKGLEMYGKGWKKIAGLIKTRTVVQIRTHAQKYFLKLTKARQQHLDHSNNSGGLNLEGKVIGGGLNRRRIKRRERDQLGIAAPLLPFLRKSNVPDKPIDIDEGLYNFLSPTLLPTTFPQNSSSVLSSSKSIGNLPSSSGYGNETHQHHKSGGSTSSSKLIRHNMDGCEIDLSSSSAKSYHYSSTPHHETSDRKFGMHANSEESGRDGSSSSSSKQRLQDGSNNPGYPVDHDSMHPGVDDHDHSLLFDGDKLMLHHFEQTLSSILELDQERVHDTDSASDSMTQGGQEYGTNDQRYDMQEGDMQGYVDGNNGTVGGNYNIAETPTVASQPQDQTVISTVFERPSWFTKGGNIMALLREASQLNWYDDSGTAVPLEEELAAAAEPNTKATASSSTANATATTNPSSSSTSLAGMSGAAVGSNTSGMNNTTLSAIKLGSGLNGSGMGGKGISSTSGEMTFLEKSPSCSLPNNVAPYGYPMPMLLNDNTVGNINYNTKAYANQGAVNPNLNNGSLTPNLNSSAQEIRQGYPSQAYVSAATSNPPNGHQAIQTGSNMSLLMSQKNVPPATLKMNSQLNATATVNSASANLSLNSTSPSLSLPAHSSMDANMNYQQSSLHPFLQRASTVAPASTPASGLSNNSSGTSVSFYSTQAPLLFPTTLVGNQMNGQQQAPAGSSMTSTSDANNILNHFNSMQNGALANNYAWAYPAVGGLANSTSSNLPNATNLMSMALGSGATSPFPMYTPQQLQQQLHLQSSRLPTTQTSGDASVQVNKSKYNPNLQMLPSSYTAGTQSRTMTGSNLVQLSLNVQNVPNSTSLDGKSTTEMAINQMYKPPLVSYDRIPVYPYQRQPPVASQSSAVPNPLVGSDGSNNNSNISAAVNTLSTSTSSPGNFIYNPSTSNSSLNTLNSLSSSLQQQYANLLNSANNSMYLSTFQSPLTAHGNIRGATLPMAQTPYMMPDSGLSTLGSLSNQQQSTGLMGAPGAGNINTFTGYSTGETTINSNKDDTNNQNSLANLLANLRNTVMPDKPFMPTAGNSFSSELTYASNIPSVCSASGSSAENLSKSPMHGFLPPTSLQPVDPSSISTKGPTTALATSTIAASFPQPASDTVDGNGPSIGTAEVSQAAITDQHIQPTVATIPAPNSTLLTVAFASSSGFKNCMTPKALVSGQAESNVQMSNQCIPDVDGGDSSANPVIKGDASNNDSAMATRKPRDVTQPAGANRSGTYTKKKKTS